MQAITGRPSLPRGLEIATFATLIVAVSLLFVLSIWAFLGAILWALIASVVFEPLHQALLRRLGGRNGAAATLTLLVIAAVVIVPALLLSGIVIGEATSLYARFQAGEIDVPGWFSQIYNLLPDWLTDWMSRTGLTNLDAVRERLSGGLASGFQTVTARVIDIGQGMFGFVVGLGVMLYLTFFLLRDGRALASEVGKAVPLHPERRAVLADRFTAVVRATVKGTVVVALVQGVMGGVLFWLLGISQALLWGVLIGFAALLPAVGAGLIWVPVALYLFATGALWQAVVLVLCGMFVIGMVDNVLRPILVGGETRMPDWLVLITTLGGLDMFGFNGLLLGPLAAGLLISTWNMLTDWRSGSVLPRQVEHPSSPSGGGRGGSA